MSRRQSKRGQNEGSISERKDGRWEARLTLPDGSRRSFYGPTKKAAWAKLVDARRNVDEGRAPVDSSTPLSVFLERWLESVAPSVKPQTSVAYRQRVRLHIAPSLGHLPLAKLAPDHVVRLVSELTGKGLSPSYISEILSTLSSSLIVAESWGLVSRNVAALVSPPRSLPRSVRALTLDEANRFLTAAAASPWYALYAMALGVGLRRGELLGLCWADIDFSRNLIIVRNNLALTDEGFVLDSPKTGSSRRVVPLLPALRPALLERVESELASGRYRPDGPVFARPDGSHARPSTIRKDFAAVVARANVAPLSLHQLRHSCATLLQERGVSGRVVMELLGHSSIRVTLDLYTHVSADSMSAAVQGLNDALFGVSGARLASTLASNDAQVVDFPRKSS